MVLKAQPEPTPSSNNSMLSASTNLPNNSFGSMPPQPVLGSANGVGGGLLGNPQPSGGLFGNQIQQQSQKGGGDLFSNQVQQQPQTGGLFGNQAQQQHQNGGLLANPQTSGGLLGNQQPSNVHSSFASSGLPPNLATLFSDPTIHPQLLENGIESASTSGGLSMNPQPSQTVLSSKNTNQTSDSQRKSFVTTQTAKPSSNAFPDPSFMKDLPIKFEKKKLESNSGTFNYEFNKMLFVSSLVQTIKKHNMHMPENLLDGTDFVPQLLAFLEQFNISLPTENVPQFQIGSVTQLLPDATSE